MIKNSIAAILIVFWTGAMFGQPIARVENVKIKSAVLNQDREILIYTPVDYDWRTNEFFNVIYIFDSQNREFFDYTSSIISFLTDPSKSFIVVGITSPYKQLINFDYSQIDKPTSLFISHANEGTDYWKEWNPARDKVNSFINQSVQNNNLKIEINEFPENNHWNTFPPSLNKALAFYY